MEIGKEIRKIRKKKGWSQTLLAQRAQTNQQHISKIENNSEIEWSTLRKVLMALDHEIILREAASGFKKALSQKVEKLEKLASFDNFLFEPPTPSQALARVAELAALYHLTQGLSFPNETALRKEGVSLLAARAILSQVRLA